MTVALFLRLERGRGWKRGEVGKGARLEKGTLLVFDRLENGKGDRMEKGTLLVFDRLAWPAWTTEGEGQAQA